MKRLIARARNDEGGAALVLCLVFLTFFGVVTVALLDYTSSSILSTSGYRESRDRVYAADSVAEGAINRVRVYRDQRNANGCFQSTVNGQSLRVDCAGAGPTDNVTMTVCSSVTAPCPANDVRLVAVVKYSTNLPTAPIKVSSWSVRK